MSELERAPCRKFKKRHRKDLSCKEIEEIVAATKAPLRLHKDIAQQYRVPANLVGRLAKEARLQPEKIEKLQTEELLSVRKRQVIEDAVTGMLAVNKPIARIQQVQVVVTE